MYIGYLKERYIATLLFLSSFLLISGCSKHAPAFDESELKPAGGMTVKRLNKLSYVSPGENVTGIQKLNFWSGFSFFRDPWVIAPSSTKSRDGLGPLFNTRSCIACHDAGSRGPLSEIGESIPTSLVIKFGKLSSHQSDDTLSNTDPNYGDQFQPRAILFKPKQMKEFVQGEGQLQLSYTFIEGQYADGTAYELRKPEYKLTQLAYGNISKHIGVTPRFAPNIYGTGLLDAIKVDDLLAQEDIDDSNKDGISAKYNRVPNIEEKTTEVGRFGLKSNHPTLVQQIGAAFRNDIGITNPIFPEESCTASQTLCQEAVTITNQYDRSDIPGENVEINRKLFNLVVMFNQLIGVPPARNLQSETVQKGREYFYQLGCQQCHQPSYTTDENYPVEALAGQKIWPYTNLALHDMGEGLADNVIDHDASGTEWRTPPLWGIGLQESTTGRTEFLHDGRARSISEAILWHGGEAKKSQQQFLQLTKKEREALLLFIKSI